MADLESSGRDCVRLKADGVGERVPARGCGFVHSVFARACNIEMQGGELVTVLASGLGATPHGIQLEAQPPPFDAWLRTGQSSVLDGAVLRLPTAGVSVDLSAASRWRGAVGAASPEDGATANRLRTLRAMLCECAPRQGISLALLPPASSLTSLQRALASRLSQVLPMLARATRRRDIAGMAGSAERLVGLGPGLTPAGDDFLAGWLATLWSQAALERDLNALLEPLVAALAPVFRRTHGISRQMLDDAASGCFAQTLVEVTMALAGEGTIARACERALTNGHSSGADALCGVLFGFAPELLLSGKELRAARAMRSRTGGDTIAPIGSH